ncbi:MAG: Rnf-Nqr domain containing protein [Dehalococcoidia bacterium]
MSIKSLLADDGHGGLALGALPLLALTTAGFEALIGGLGITIILLLTVALVRAGLRVMHEAKPYVLIVAAGTAASAVSLTIGALFPAHIANLGLYIPVMALSSLVLSTAAAAGDARWGQALSGGLSRGLVLTVLMVLLGVAREVLGQGQVFGSPVMEAPVHLIALAPGALLLVGGLLGLAQWAAARSASLAEAPARSGDSEAVRR